MTANISFRGFIGIKYSLKLCDLVHFYLTLKNFFAKDYKDLNRFNPFESVANLTFFNKTIQILLFYQTKSFSFRLQRIILNIYKAK